MERERNTSELLNEMEKERTFDTPAAVQQRADVPLDGADADELVAHEVGVMRRGDVVLGQGSCHVMGDTAVLVHEHRVIGREKKGGERLWRHDA